MTSPTLPSSASRRTSPTSGSLVNPYKWLTFPVRPVYTQDMNTTSTYDPQNPTRHRYVAPMIASWRTCQVCGHGANSSLHKPHEGEGGR